MIEFRQKGFAKKFRLKKAKEWAVSKAKDLNPAMLAISGIGTGYGIANYQVNKKRQIADEELRKQQIEATNELSEALKKVNDLSKKDAKRHSKKMKEAYNRPDPDEEHPYITERAKKVVFRGKTKND